MRKSFLFILFLCTIVNAQNRITIIGEIRFEDNEKFRYRQTTNIDLVEKKDDGSNGQVFPNARTSKKESYDRKPGTELAFEIPLDLYQNRLQSTFSKKIDALCKFKFKSLQSQNDDNCEIQLEINLGDVIILNANTIKLQDPIYLSDPERLTLTMMIKDIEDDLDDRSYSYYKSLNKLSKGIDFLNQKNFDYETMIEFYEFLMFTEKYVSENSFFQREAEKLEKRILKLNNSSNKSDSLSDELIKSNEIFQVYLKKYSELKNYNSQLKLILFLDKK